ncbi:response regulator [Brevibacillus humidisoli]|uniref:response regulator n=1 Tax=Brevibacillus humidisoli TaxID=2895522 RepID=UPI001E2CC6E6|nr:response regulator [Brevibacillus humidisoli]UFJ42557.1 response regulator [Brevibacillus humidisoli]
MNKQIRVLIVEDDLRIAEINRRFIEKIEGFEIVGLACDGAEAKEQIEILEPDLLLLDVYLPDMLGVELVRYVRIHYPELDIMMITAAKEVETLRTALRGGVFDYMIKPIVFERFRERMEAYRKQFIRLHQSDTLEQEEIDRLWARGREAGRSITPQLPKGIDSVTLEKVKEAVAATSGTGVTAEDVAKVIGASRTTARRYLEFLTEAGQVYTDLVYGTVGRPERRYIWKSD